MTEGTRAGRPALITAAIWLSVVANVASVVVGLTGLFINPPLANGRQVPMWAMETTVVLAVALAAFDLLLLWLMARRRRWAYIVYLVLTLLGILNLPVSARHALTANLATSLNFVIHGAAQVIVVILLLTTSSRAWFAAPSASELRAT